jgi:hypothetical protein
MKRPLSPIFLLVPGMILVACPFILTDSGALSFFYAAGIIFSLPNIGFSAGWPKWAAIAMVCVFVTFMLTEITQLRTMATRARAELIQTRATAHPTPAQ